MWSEGGWTGPDYSVAYAIADSPFGPFEREAKILKQDSTVARGAGHHSVIIKPEADEYYIVYHRRPLGETNGNYRVTCIEYTLNIALLYTRTIILIFGTLTLVGSNKQRSFCRRNKVILGAHRSNNCKQ